MSENPMAPPPPLQRTNAPSGSQSTAGQRPVVVVPTPGSRSNAVNLQAQHALASQMPSSQIVSNRSASRHYARPENGKRQEAGNASGLVTLNKERPPSSVLSVRADAVTSHLTDKDINQPVSVSQPNHLTPSKIPSRWRMERAQPFQQPTNEGSYKPPHELAMVNIPSRTSARSASGNEPAPGSGHALLNSPVNRWKPSKGSTSAILLATTSSHPIGTSQPPSAAPPSTAPIGFAAINARHGLRSSDHSSRPVTEDQPAEAGGGRANKRRRVVPDDEQPASSRPDRTDPSPGLFVTPDKPKERLATGTNATHASQASQGPTRLSSGKLNRSSYRILSDAVESGDASAHGSRADRRSSATEYPYQIRFPAAARSAQMKPRQEPTQGDQVITSVDVGVAKAEVLGEAEPSASQPMRDRKGRFSSHKRKNGAC